MEGNNINIPAAFEQEVVYKECWRNHAASLGRIAYDGCSEFLKPSIGHVIGGGSEEAMFCAACSCHRNFHLKETVYNPIMTAAATAIPQTLNQPDFPPTTAAGPSNFPTTMTTALIAQNNNNNDTEEGPVVPPKKCQKKRTKFTAEQRSRMVRFAERLGWRPQRADDEEINEFCNEVGISRRMLIVWLSNNRRRATQNHTAAATTTVDGRI